MAKRVEQKAKANGNGHNRVQGFVFGINLEGSQDVVMEGIKAFTTAMAKSGTTLLPVVTRPVLESGKQSAAAAAATDVVDQIEDPGNRGEEISEEESTTPTAEETSGDGAQKAVRRVPKTPVVLNDIDFSAGKVSLKDFVAQKNPGDKYEKYAVITVWYKENHNLEEVNSDRIYTAYKFLDWVPPNDVAQVLRDLKFSKKWFDKGTGRGGYKINIIGLNKVAAGFTK